MFSNPTRPDLLNAWRRYLVATTSRERLPLSGGQQTALPGFCLLLESDPGTGVDEILLEDLSGCILQQDAP